MRPAFLWISNLSCFKVMLDISFMPLFPAINKYGTEKRTHRYPCISVLAERTHMCSVTPFPMGVWQKFLNVSHVRGNNRASRETHIWICLTVCLEFYHFLLFLSFSHLPINYLQEARENKVSFYWCYPRRWEENQEHNAIISHCLPRHGIIRVTFKAYQHK